MWSIPTAGQKTICQATFGHRQSARSSTLEKALSEKLPKVELTSPEEMKALTLEGVADAPVVYVDGYQGAMVGNGTIKINFFHDLLDTKTNKHIRQCNLVLVVSLPIFESMRATFNDLGTTLGEQGMLIVKEVKADLNPK
jgi:hypothetical protein